MTKHTPTPYHVAIQTRQQAYETCAQYRAEVWAEDIDAEQPVALCVDDDDAAFVARAVNSHEELLRIVKTIAEHFNDGADKVYRDALSPDSDDVTLGEWINQTIAKAEGK